MKHQNKSLNRDLRRKVIREYAPVLPELVETPILKAYIGANEVCNLRCPFCATGNGSLQLSRKLMSLEQYKAVLDNLGPGLRLVALYHWGESLLNPGIFDMIRETAARNIFTVIHANLSHSWFDRAMAEKLARSGLSWLVVSCDGASQETYEQYRVRGDFSLVMRNMRLLVAAKRRLRRDSPRITWKFLIHKGNQHETAKAAKIAKELGVDMRFEPLEIPQSSAETEKWSPDEGLEHYQGMVKSYSKKLKIESQFAAKIHCFSAWQMPSITPDGEVLPCGVLHSDEFSLGNIYKEDFRKIWNKPLALAMRRYLKTGRRSALKLPCYTCELSPYAHRASALRRPQLFAGKVFANNRNSRESVLNK